VGEENRPGSIQIWKSNLEKINEVQAHAKGVERMRISFDNNFLFTAGRDGTLIIHDIKDRDPRGGVIKRDFGGVLNFSEEILTEKQEMEEFETVRE
jgi:cilia- and flagella-associated protein 57